jgi:hypothetical protein
MSSSNDPENQKWGVGIALLITIISVVIALFVIGIIGGVKGLQIGRTCKNKTVWALGLSAIILSVIPTPGLGFVLGIIAWVMSNNEAKSAACKALLNK